MKYISTRGAAPEKGFKDVVLAGLASDGGLYVPETWPQLSAQDISIFAHASYVDVALQVMRPFIGADIPEQELKRIVHAAYCVFEVDEVVPLKKINDVLYVAELFHGPTLAFKDVALQFLGHVFAYFLSQDNSRVTIVGATSGDTGSAAIAAFASIKGADIFIMHPKGRVSDVQRRQMTTVLSKNVHNIAVEGSFDMCQSLVKSMFADEKFRNDMHLSAVNSINWARILAQVVYYVYLSSRFYAETGKAAVFSVPSGNFGNVYAGYVAKKMGAPIDRLIVATNANDILHRFFSSGRMMPLPSTPTISPSMDIQASSNFERVLFDIVNRHGDAVAKTQHFFSKGLPYHLDAETMKRVNAVFSSGRKNDEQTLDIMQRIWADKKYMIDPHTAVGVGVAEDFIRDYQGSAVICLATAHPAKFPDAVVKATGQTPALPPHMSDLFQREERLSTLSPDLGGIQKYIKSRVVGR